MIEPVLVEVPNPGHPYGAKGVAEVNICPPMAAIANAIERAIGQAADRAADVAAESARRDRRGRIGTGMIGLCTENLNPHIIIMKCTKDCV